MSEKIALCSLHFLPNRTFIILTEGTINLIYIYFIRTCVQCLINGSYVSFFTHYSIVWTYHKKGKHISNKSKWPSSTNQDRYKGMVIGRLVARDAERNQSASTLNVAKTDNLKLTLMFFALSRYYLISYFLKMKKTMKFYKLIENKSNRTVFNV